MSATISGTPISRTDLVAQVVQEVGASGLFGSDLSGADVRPTDTGATLTLSAAFAARLAVAGGVMLGALTLAGNPTASLQAVPKQYVDAETTRAQAVEATLLSLAAELSRGRSGLVPIFYLGANLQFHRRLTRQRRRDYLAGQRNRHRPHACCAVFRRSQHFRFRSQRRNGSTPDDPAFRLAAASGKKVKVPAGVYRYTGAYCVLASNTQFYGDGPSKTVIKPDSLSNADGTRTIFVNTLRIL